MLGQRQRWADDINNKNGLIGNFEDYPVGKRADYRACFELKLVCFHTRTVSF